MANSTWNPADLVAITLSGLNLTATSTAQGAVRSVAGMVGSKYYWEVTFGSTGTRSSTAFGACNSAANLSNVVVNASGAALCNGNGAISVNGTAQTGVGAFAANGVCCFALDKGGNLIWFRNGAAGNWNGSGTANPATGAGGYSVSGLTGGTASLFAFVGGTTSAAAATTANFGDTAFAGTVPSGFTAGIPVGGGSQQAMVLVMA